MVVGEGAGELTDGQSGREPLGGYVAVPTGRRADQQRCDGENHHGHGRHDEKCPSRPAQPLGGRGARGEGSAAGRDVDRVDGVAIAQRLRHRGRDDRVRALGHRFHPRSMASARRPRYAWVFTEPVLHPSSSATAATLSSS